MTADVKEKSGGERKGGGYNGGVKGGVSPPYAILLLIQSVESSIALLLRQQPISVILSLT